MTTAGVLTRESRSLCAWRRWVWTSWAAESQRSWTAVNRMRQSPWVSTEGGMREAFGRRGIQLLLGQPQKAVFLGKWIPMLWIKRSRDRLIFNIGVPIPVRRQLYIETAAPRRDVYGCPVCVCDSYVSDGIVRMCIWAMAMSGANGGCPGS